ncbi:alpha/beta hydrolase [Haematospirillum sp. H1815]|uniref:alpha/beta hydrolase n=1 Tax=Haematospirillum sp. H1815 TaxID=2723108 RepID=UPI00143C79F5|nr:alpha/beta hydrolase [Haematospirillum sp. H1815]NKD76686.1 alpha/beta hydrolase [Haematospirillum sp. H1815]
MHEVIFNGPEGRLEGRYHHSSNANAPVALVLHSHPQHGGTMNQRIVFDLSHVFAQRGFSVLRFNFRGVGRSQGSFDSGQGELSDAASALDWMQAINPHAGQCWVAGFAFGAWIGMQLLMRRPEISGFVSVAPPASHYDFSFLAPCPSPGLIVHGAADRVVSAESVKKLADKLQAQKNISVDHVSIPGADHFFSGHIDTVVSTVDSYIAKSMVMA